MTDTYESYKSARIANQESVIYEFEGCFSTIKGIGSKECNPADHCVTVEQFLNENEALPLGALISHPDGSSNYLEDERMIDICSTDLDSFVVLPQSIEDK